MNVNGFLAPASVQLGRKVRLLQPISAVQVLDGEGAKLGVFSQLGPGTTVECCGSGYNEHTVKVRVKGHSYFVFSRDLKDQAAAAKADFQ